MALLNSEFRTLDFSTSLQQDYFKKDIENMAAKSLRCVALAYKTCETIQVPTGEEQLAQWVPPEDELILLAIVGIKVSGLVDLLLCFATYLFDFVPLLLLKSCLPALALLA